MKVLSRLHDLYKVFAFAALALTPVTVSALDPEKVPSIGADMGRFNLPIECDIKLPSLGDTPLATIGANADIQGIAPVELGPGQTFFLSQGSGSLTLPAWLSTLGGIVTIKSADANVDSLRIGARGASPAVFDLADAYDLSVEDIPVTPGEPVQVGLPKTGDFRVGPFTAPEDGRIQFRFEGASADITLESTFGVEIQARAECASTDSNALLLVGVSDDVDPSEPALFEGEPLDLDPVEPGYLTGIVHAPYTCDIGGRNHEVGIAVGAIIPIAVERFHTMTFDEASGAITLPPATVNSLMDAGYTTVEGRVNKLNLVVENGFVTNPNVLPGGEPLPRVTLERDQRLTIPVPADGSTLTAGPFFPGWFAESMVVGLGTASASLEFNGNGQTVEASCPMPDPNALLIDAPII